jgi:hypothetical protein
MANGDFSGVSTVPYWKVAGAQAEKDPYGFSDAPYGAPTEDKSLPQYQLEEHVKSAQQMGQLQAARRGFNPLMTRAATESGAELGSMAQGQSEALAMQERMNQLQGRLAQQQGLSEAEMQRMGIETGQMGLSAQQSAFQKQMQAQLEQQQREQQGKLGMGILGGVTSLIGGLLSDERMKQNIESAPREADARLEALAQALRPVGSASGAKMVGQWQPDAVDPEVGSWGTPRTAIVYTGSAKLPQAARTESKPESKATAMAQEQNPLDVQRGVMITDLGEGGPEQPQYQAAPARSMGRAVVLGEGSDYSGETFDQRRRRLMEKAGIVPQVSAVRSAEAQRVIGQEMPKATAMVAQAAQPDYVTPGSPDYISDEEYGFQPEPPAQPRHFVMPEQVLIGTAADRAGRALVSERGGRIAFPTQYISSGADQTQAEVARQAPQAARFVQQVAEPSAEQLLRRREADRRAAALSSALQQTNAQVESRLNRPESQRTQDLANALSQYGEEWSQKFNAKPYSFQYKPGLGQPAGQQFGVMAQDLLGGPMGDAVVPTQRGLAISPTRAVGPMLGMLGQLSDKIKRLEKK